jgi:tRNA-splicing ligase RtcB
MKVSSNNMRAYTYHCMLILKRYSSINSISNFNILCQANFCVEDPSSQALRDQNLKWWSELGEFGKLTVQLERVSDYIWEIPKSFNPAMRVPARVFADETLLNKMKEDRTLLQAANVASLPGLYKYSIALPDAHEGYGFPIGGVAAEDAEEGVISPGGIGYDINCGVRLVRTNLTEQEVRPKLSELTEQLFNLIPSGVGSEGKLHFSPDGLSVVAEGGASWAVENGYGWNEDVEHAEENGRLGWADFTKVSHTARKRGSDQLGTLGSGNHFVEIERVDRIYDERAAKAMGITQEGQILALVHTGSRGFGHQTCSDYLRVMEGLMKRYDIRLPDRELACGPVKAKETEDYLGAMASAANFAWANRQVITHRIREAFKRVFRTDAEKLDMHLIYDVCHNIVKREEHIIDGVKRLVYVHRKGATRAFPAGSQYIPRSYREIGQPVLIPGSMGTASWVLKGGEASMELTFGSAAHGAGRFMSRSAAKRKHVYNELVGGLHQKGIMIRASSKETVLEESPDAYKDVDNVVEVTHKLGLATKVVRMTPIGVVKG